MSDRTPREKLVDAVDRALRVAAHSNEGLREDDASKIAERVIERLDEYLAYMKTQDPPHQGPYR